VQLILLPASLQRQALLLFRVSGHWLA
jgi:hypothetical protein